MVQPAACSQAKIYLCANDEKMGRHGFAGDFIYNLLLLVGVQQMHRAFLNTTYVLCVFY